MSKNFSIVLFSRNKCVPLPKNDTQADNIHPVVGSIRNLRNDTNRPYSRHSLCGMVGRHPCPLLGCHQLPPAVLRWRQCLCPEDNEMGKMVVPPPGDPHNPRGSTALQHISLLIQVIIRTFTLAQAPFSEVPPWGISNPQPSNPQPYLTSTHATFSIPSASQRNRGPR